jgi:hypothetical protein
MLPPPGVFQESDNMYVGRPESRDHLAIKENEMNKIKKIILCNYYSP